MKKIKYFAAMAAAAIMMVGTTMTSFAREYQYNTGSTEIIEDEMGKWASGRKKEVPGWVWVNGYCYYYLDKNSNKATNCVTPDGYTVDEEGRWTVDGVPQYNGYGSIVIGTDELYANKNDDERWLIMKDKLEKLFANYNSGSDYMVAMMSVGDTVFCGWSRDGGCTHSVIHNSEMNYSYIDASIGNFWNDDLDSVGSYRTEIIEQIIKIICGDHVGQELFNDIKAAADPCEGGPREDIIYDENGNLIFTDDYHILTKTVEKSSDGVNFDYFDLNKWNGRKTDYGKTIRITSVNSFTNAWNIIIEK